MTIHKAVFPVAGLGTRFLPATKANPKEMMPIVDKPLIQYAVEEAIDAGVRELIFVTSSSKRAIEDHFDSNYELESRLEERGKLELLSIVRDILPQGVKCSYVRQPHQRGLGDAVLCAEHIVGHEAFAVLLADDLIDAREFNCLANMIKLHEQTNASVIAAEQVARADTERYGIIALADDQSIPGKMRGIVEKPKAENAPSTLAAVGRYILTPKIFHYLRYQTPGAGGEIQLTDAISTLMSEQDIFAYQFKGTRYDCGSKLGYLQATLAYAATDPDVGPAFTHHLQQFLGAIQE